MPTDLMNGAAHMLEETAHSVGDVPLDASSPTRRLIEAWRRGSPVAEEQLFVRHRDALLDEARRSRMMRFLRARTTAEDLVDEVFVRALASGLLAKFEHRGPGTLRHSLGRVLQHVLKDACRRAGARRRRPPSGSRETSDEQAAAVAVARDESPSEQARANELLALCRSELPRKEWNAWWLVEIRGLSSVEASAQLGMTPAAVRGLRLRARARLMARLSGGAARLTPDGAVAGGDHAVSGHP